MLRYFFLLSILTFIMSCGNSDSNTDATITAETSPASEVVTAPQAPTIPKDQGEHTAAASPEVVNEAKVPTPDIKQKTPVVNPENPKQPVPKATKPIATTTSTSPAPTAPVSAPATAPTIETPAAIPEPPTAPAAPASSTPATPAAPAAPEKPDHTAFNTLLSKHVNNRGDVNYAAFKKDEAKLDAYIAELSENSPKSDWGRNESMAYWINAYNANTLKLILKNYPLKSIIDLDGGKPWDVKWIKIGGKTYSLNNIEHDIIRPRYKDARIHFAVNCAAASCPPLPNKAFTAANLNSLLASRTKSFVRNASYNTISTGDVQVSKIFDWYGKDFGNLRDFLNKYATLEIPEGTNIGFKEYDWALNKQ